MRLPAQAARQLPDQSTTLRVDSSSTDDSRLRCALPIADIAAGRALAAGSPGCSATANVAVRQDAESVAPVREHWARPGVSTAAVHAVLRVTSGDSR